MEMNENKSHTNECDHDWKEVDSQFEGDVRCSVCGMHGYLEDDGNVFYPAS
jgi:hypothetical protein